MILWESAEATPASHKRMLKAGSPSERPSLASGRATSETRASSSPPSLHGPGTPWTAVRKLDQVFDMATPDSAGRDCEASLLARSPEQLRSPALAKQPAGSPFRAIRLKLSSRLMAVSPSDALAEELTNHASPTASSEGRNCVKHASPAASDAWSVEEWEKLLLHKARPCTAAQKLHKGQREVADAVFAEVQVDVESVVQRVVSQMSSWISAEVAFARRGLEKEVRTAFTQAQEARVKYDVETEHGQIQLHSKVDLLQKDLAELALVVGTLREKLHHGPAEGDLQLDVRLTTIEAALCKHSTGMDALDKHVAHCDTLLGASRQDLDRHRSELMRLAERTGDAHADLHTGDARADLMAWELRRIHTSLSEELAGKATLAEVNETRMAVNTWVEDTRKVHQSSTDGLTNVIEQCRSSCVAHSVMLNRHEEWMKELSYLL